MTPLIIGITVTGYPVGLSKIHPAYCDAIWAMVGSGGNLDGPQAVLSGAVFYSRLLREAVPGIAGLR